MKLLYSELENCFSGDVCKHYYEKLKKKRNALFFKRCFDIIVAVLMLMILTPIFFIIAIMIKCDSKGSVLYKQKRVTRDNKDFYIYKFRTMVQNADKIGSLVTVKSDSRVTKAGRFLRKYRLDEIPQLLNIIKGDMSFVGARPEVRKYVEYYNDEMYATLLMPAGVTSLASIYYKDEERLLEDAENADEFYINKILPEKMKYNLKYIETFGFWNDILIMIKTVLAVVEKDKAAQPENTEVEANV